MQVCGMREDEQAAARDCIVRAVEAARGVAAARRVPRLAVVTDLGADRESAATVVVKVTGRTVPLLILVAASVAWAGPVWESRVGSVGVVDVHEAALVWSGQWVALDAHDLPELHDLLADGLDGLRESVQAIAGPVGGAL